MSTSKALEALSRSIIRKPTQPVQESLPIAINRCRELVRAASHDPLTAGRMAEDPSLPAVVRSTAAALAGDPRDRMAFRRMLDQIAADPNAASEWARLWRESEGPSHHVTRLCELFERHCGQAQQPAVPSFMS